LNPNPNVIPIIEQNLHRLNKYDWENLSLNPNALSIMQRYPDKIDFIKMMYFNPNAVEINYEFVRSRMFILLEDLMKVAWNPKRVEKWVEEGFYNE
jgi:hypothetical protein